MASTGHGVIVMRTGPRRSSSKIPVGSALGLPAGTFTCPCELRRLAAPRSRVQKRAACVETDEGRIPERHGSRETWSVTGLLRQNCHRCPETWQTTREPQRFIRPHDFFAMRSDESWWLEFCRAFCEVLEACSPRVWKGAWGSSGTQKGVRTGMAPVLTPFSAAR